MQIQDWGTLAKKIREILRGFRDLDLHVLFIAQESVQKDGDKIEKIIPNLNGKASDEIAYFMDIVGYMTIDNATGARKVITQWNSKYVTKDRTGKIWNGTEPDFGVWVEKVKDLEVSEEEIIETDTPDDDLNLKFNDDLTNCTNLDELKLVFLEIIKKKETLWERNYNFLVSLKDDMKASLSSKPETPKKIAMKKKETLEETIQKEEAEKISENVKNKPEEVSKKSLDEMINDMA